MAIVRKIEKNKWIIDARGIGNNGQRVFRGTKIEAERELARLMAEGGKRQTDPQDIPTVWRAALQFLDAQKRRVCDGEIGYGEYRNKELHIRHFCGVKLRRAEVGERKISDLRYEDFDEVIVPALKRKRALATVRRIMVTIKQFLNWCARKRWIASNPAQTITISFRGQRRKELRIISPAEMALVIEHAPQDYRRQIAFSAYTGLRAGETVALTWDNVDLESAKVHVRQARKWGGQIGEPKTDKAYRTLSMPASLVKMLREWKVLQPIEMRRRNLVFPSGTGEVADSGNWRKRGLAVACKRAAVEPMTWHDLRHFYASCMIFDERTSDAKVAQFLGHSSIDFTYKVYARYFDNVADSTNDGDVLDRVLGVSL